MVQLLRLLDVSPLDILPQRPPFILIDRLTHYDETVTAQTCAARLGYYNLISGLPVKIGFIGAVSNLHILRVPVVGECLDTTIRVKEEVFGMTLVDAETRVGEEVIATARK